MSCDVGRQEVSRCCTIGENLKNPLHVDMEACKRGIHSDFETQGRRHQKSKTGVSVVPEKGLMSSQLVFTVRKRSCRKVMFSHLSVSHSAHKGACMAMGVHGRVACISGQGRHVWWGGMHGRGCVWQGGMHGREHAWQERWSLQRTVRILLECILVKKYDSPMFVG